MNTLITLLFEYYINLSEQDIRHFFFHTSAGINFNIVFSEKRNSSFPFTLIILRTVSGIIFMLIIYNIWLINQKSLLIYANYYDWFDLIEIYIR